MTVSTNGSTTAGAADARVAVVDLRSDTVTQPTAGMRAAMAAAPLGDDVFGDDPSVNALQSALAERASRELRQGRVELLSSHRRATRVRPVPRLPSWICSPRTRSTSFESA